jgi:hypothetical protein
MTLGVLRLDGAPNQRGAEITRVAAKLGASIEHPVPHDHRSMGAIEGYHSGDLKAGVASLHDAGASIFMWCFFMKNARNAENYVPRRDEKISPYALAHSHVEFKRNALALRCKRAGCLDYCHISQEVRTKMGLRGCAAILLSEVIFNGYASYWFLSIGTAVLLVCNSFTMIETEMPFRDPRVWESFGMTFGDHDASFGVQVVAQHRRGYVTDLMVPLDLSYKLPKSASERFGFTVEDEMLSPAKEQRIINVGRRHRNNASGLTMPDATGQPIFATRPPPMPRLPPLHFPGDHGG